MVHAVSVEGEEGRYRLQRVVTMYAGLLIEAGVGIQCVECCVNWPSLVRVYIENCAAYDSSNLPGHCVPSP